MNTDNEKNFVGYWFLFTLRNPDKILMALYFHDLHNMQNTIPYRHNVSEFKLSSEMIVLDIPLRPEIQHYVRSAVMGMDCKLPELILPVGPKRGVVDPSSSSTNLKLLHFSCKFFYTRVGSMCRCHLGGFFFWMLTWLGSNKTQHDQL